MANIDEQILQYKQRLAECMTKETLQKEAVAIYGEMVANEKTQQGEVLQILAAIRSHAANPEKDEFAEFRELAREKSDKLGIY